MNERMRDVAKEIVTKVPAVTLGFWVIKIAATTLGETGGDWVTMSLGLGYLIGTLIFAAIFVAVVAAQVSARKFHPFLYGRLSSPRRRSAPRSRTFVIAPSASAILEGWRSSLPCLWRVWWRGT